MNPVRSLQNIYQAKRELRIAVSFSGRSASPVTESAYSADALRMYYKGKLLTG